LNRLFDIQDSILTGEFSAARMRADSDVRLRDNPEIKGDVDLFDAKVGGELRTRQEISESTFERVRYRFTTGF
jgi:hypothetical protein